MQVYAPTTKAEEAKVEWLYKDLQDLLELTPEKEVLFIIRDWNAKLRSQVIPGVTGKFGLEEKMNQSFAKRMHWSQQTPSSNNTREVFIHGHHQMSIWNQLKSIWIKTKSIWINQTKSIWNQIDYILRSWRQRNSLQSAKRRLGADCGSDHEHFIAKFRNKLKKVGKITGSFRFDINQIPSKCTVEVTNRFKGLDLIDRMS